jgi:hypothetical protein
LPLESALVVIQVREHENNRHEINELHERVDNLIKELRELKKKLDEKE